MKRRGFLASLLGSLALPVIAKLPDLPKVIEPDLVWTKPREEYVSYVFKNTDDKFFDVHAYTGNGTSCTVPHNLGFKPKQVIIKSKNSPGNWEVLHSGDPLPNDIGKEYLQYSFAGDASLKVEPLLATLGH